MSVKSELLKKIAADASPTGTQKITIVGAGQVGMAAAITMLTQNVTNEICLIDIGKEKLMGEMMDLQHGSNFLNNAKITSSSDYAAAAGSRICVITAGVRQKDGESRLSLVQRNIDILKDMILQLVKSSPNTILLMVTNPVDIMTYAAWKLSCLPKNRVIGTGTNLDSARFRFLISQRLSLAPTSCHGWIIGEHGDNSVPVWSGVNVAGVRLCELNPKIGTSEDTENWQEVHGQVVSAAYEVIRLKGYTSWAIGLSTTSLCAAILTNSNQVVAISTSVLGEHGIDKDVYLSLPCVLNSNGVRYVVKQVLAPAERDQLHNSANVMHEVQSGIKF